MQENAWAELLKALDPDARKASQRLQKLVDKLVRIFEWRGCHQPSDAAFEVVHRVALKLHQGAELTTSIERYASGFVHPVFHEYLRRQKKEQKMLDELQQQSPQEHDAEQEGNLVCLDQCMEELLSITEQDLLLEFHAYEGGARIKARRELAESRGKTVNALRIETHRMRKRLRSCVEHCLQRAPT